MIGYRINLSAYLEVVDADADGFTLTNPDPDSEGGSVWVSWEQLEDLNRVATMMGKGPTP